VSAQSKTRGKTSNGVLPRPSAPAWPAPTILANVRVIPLAQLEPDPDQPRKEFDPETIADLAGSIVEVGQLLPLRVRPLKGEGHRYAIVDGERRWRAAQHAGRTTLQCVVVEGHDDAGEVLIEQLAANEAREGLSPMEQAEGYLRAQELSGLSQSELARRIGVNQPLVAKRLALLKLDGHVQDLVRAGELDASSAYELRRLPSIDQAEVAALACAGGWTRARVIEEVERLLNPPTAPIPSVPIMDDAPARRAEDAAPEPPAGPGIGQAGAPGKFAAGAIRIVPADQAAIPGESNEPDPISRHLERVERITAEPRDLESLCDRIEAEDAALRERGAHVRTALLEPDDHHVTIVTGRDPECPALVTVTSNGEGHPTIPRALWLALAEALRAWPEEWARCNRCNAARPMGENPCRECGCPEFRCEMVGGDQSRGEV
jgi:ParB family chromosome partitioning protein